MIYESDNRFVADRWTTFVDTITVFGLDTNGPALLMEIRLTPDTPGDPIVRLVGVSQEGDEGLHTVSVDTSGAVPVSTIEVRIAPRAWPPAAETGDALTLACDLLATIDGDLQRIDARPFIVSAGVSRP